MSQLLTLSSSWKRLPARRVGRSVLVVSDLKESLERYLALDSHDAVVRAVSAFLLVEGIISHDVLWPIKTGRLPHDSFSNDAKFKMCLRPRVVFPYSSESLRVENFLL